MLLRVRLSAFLAGFGTAAGIALYQLRKDMTEAHSVTTAQVRRGATCCMAGTWGVHAGPRPCCWAAPPVLLPHAGLHSPLSVPRAWRGQGLHVRTMHGRRAAPAPALGASCCCCCAPMCHARLLGCWTRTQRYFCTAVLSSCCRARHARRILPRAPCSTAARAVHPVGAPQAEEFRGRLEKRVASLEAVLAEMRKPQGAAQQS